MSDERKPSPLPPEYWQTRSPAERVAEVGRLRREYIYRTLGLAPEAPEPRMDRSVFRVLTQEEWEARDRDPVGEASDE